MLACLAGTCPRFCVSARTGTVYITSYLDQAEGPQGAVTVANGKTHRVITTITDDHQAAGVAVSPLTGDVYVANMGVNYAPVFHQTGGVLVISGKTNKVIGSIAGVSSADVVAVSPLTGAVYAVGDYRGTSGVLVINGRTSKVATVIKAGGDGTGIAVSPKTGNVYVSNFGSTSGGGTTVGVINGKTGKVIAAMPDANYATGVAVSPKTAEVYVTNGTIVNANDNPRLGSVWVFSGSNKRIAIIKDGNSPWGVAVSPRTGDVYVANQGFGVNGSS